MEGRIKTKELPAVKAKLIAMQNGICPLCHNDLRKMKSVNVVVDHCHDSGRIRAAICRGCNGAEGKIKNLAVRFGKTADFVLFCQRLITYWIHHREARTPWIHPKHKDEEELRAQRNKRSRDAYAKKKAELLRRESSLKRRLK